MSGQLIPPPERAPSLPDDITPEQSIAIWIDLMKATDKFLFAGLRREVGPDGDVYEAYRRWSIEQRREKDKATQRMLARLKKYGGWDVDGSGS